VPRYEERRIDEGCWWAESPFLFQTQHGTYANTDRGNRGRLGWTKLGMPNCWGQYTHGGPDIPLGTPHLHRTFHQRGRIPGRLDQQLRGRSVQADQPSLEGW
jgi:hypothetical protein